MIRIDDGKSEYKRLPEYLALRQRELTGMMAPYMDVTDSYGELICALVLALGQKTPNDTQDEVFRDLLADVFDFLYHAGRAILESQFSVAFPLLRRAFESTSLLAVCASDSTFAEKWASGKEISNVEVRKKLSTIPLSEPLETTRELYNFFSRGSHPNRSVVPFRFLRRDNQFVLGAIGRPDLLIFCDHLRHHLSLWFWFCAVVIFNYRELTGALFGEKYLKAASDAREVAEALVNEIKRLRLNPSAR